MCYILCLLSLVLPPYKLVAKWPLSFLVMLKKSPSVWNLPLWQHPLLGCDLLRGSAVQHNFGSCLWQAIAQWVAVSPADFYETRKRLSRRKLTNERSNIYSRAVRLEVWNPEASGNRVAGKTKHWVKYKHTIIHYRLPWKSTWYIISKRNQSEIYKFFHLPNEKKIN